MVSLNGRDFTTWDQDNDRWSGNCAVDRHGGWWYNYCAYANLNGKYVGSALSAWKYPVWYHWKNKKVALKGTEMMIRPRD